MDILALLIMVAGFPEQGLAGVDTVSGAPDEPVFGVEMEAGPCVNLAVIPQVSAWKHPP
jgi:hypothetical protein